MSHTSTGNGKVVVNRSMSLDGFIAGPGHAMNWIYSSRDECGSIRAHAPHFMRARNPAAGQPIGAPSPALVGSGSA